MDELAITGKLPDYQTGIRQRFEREQLDREQYDQMTEEQQRIYWIKHFGFNQPELEPESDEPF